MDGVHYDAKFTYHPPKPRSPPYARIRNARALFPFAPPSPLPPAPPLSPLPFPFLDSPQPKSPYALTLALVVLLTSSSLLLLLSLSLSLHYGCCFSCSSPMAVVLLSIRTGAPGALFHQLPWHMVSLSNKVPTFLLSGCCSLPLCVCMFCTSICLSVPGVCLPWFKFKKFFFFLVLFWCLIC